MPWDPFLVKKLLKSEVYGSHEQYTRPTGVHKNVKNHGSTMREQYSTVHEQCTCPLKESKMQNANGSSSGSKRSLSQASADQYLLLVSFY